MKNINLIVIGILTVAATMSFTSHKNDSLNSELSAEDGWYYCVISGYYNGDSDSQGFFYSHIRYFKNDKPSNDCTKWLQFTESQLSNFKADCRTYHLYGPFDPEHTAVTHMTKKQKSQRQLGKVTGSNKGPF